MKQKLTELKEKLGKLIIIVGDCSYCSIYLLFYQKLIVPEQKINKDVVDLNTIIKHQNLSDINITPFKTAEDMFVFQALRKY